MTGNQVLFFFLIYVLSYIGITYLSIFIFYCDLKLLSNINIILLMIVYLIVFIMYVWTHVSVQSVLVTFSLPFICIIFTFIFENFTSTSPYIILFFVMIISFFLDFFAVGMVFVIWMFRDTIWERFILFLFQK